MKLLRKRVDRRKDGYRFWAYEKYKDSVRERWVHPKRFNRAKASTRLATTRWKRINGWTGGHLSKERK